MIQEVHIFNGDSTAQAFAHSTLSGGEYVVREMLCDGPCKDVPGSLTFFDTRQQFFNQSLGVSPDEYYRLTVDEWHRMTAAVRHVEWILWFEYDVFCQFNLIGTLASINHLEVMPDQVSLICVGKESPEESWKTLGDFAPDQYPTLLKKRSKLNEGALSYATQAWAAYLSDDPRQWLPFTQKQHAAFPYLAQAFQHQLLRFPSPTNGLNRIEMVILEALKSSPMKQRQLIGHMLRHHNHPWGFGDLQWAWFCKALHPLLDNDEGVLHLSERAQQVLAGKASFREHLQGRYLGGASAEEYCWDETRGSLIPYPKA